MSDPTLHRHKDLKGHWITGVPDGPHTHAEFVTIAAQLATAQKAIDDLKTRLDFLELVVCGAPKK